MHLIKRPNTFATGELVRRKMARLAKLSLPLAQKISNIPGVFESQPAAALGLLALCILRASGKALMVLKGWIFRGNEARFVPRLKSLQHPDKFLL